MAFVIADRVQETTIVVGTGTATLLGAATGYQSFSAGIGASNTTYYVIADQSGSNWEVGLGTLDATGLILTRTTILSSSNSNSVVSFPAGTKNVWCDYPAGKAVYLNSSGNVSALGTITSGVWNGTTVPVAYGGTGVTASTGANSVVLRDASVNISVNSISEGFSNVAATGTTTVLTVASVPNYVVTGSGGQTYQLPDATTLTNNANYTFNNNQSSGTIVVKNNSSTTVATIQSGGFVDVILLSNATAAGSWDVHNFAPSNVNWSTNTLDYAGSITNATWNGNTVAYNRGGTGQSSAFTAGGIVYGSTTSALAVTPIGTSGQVLTSAGAGTPIWTTPTTGTVTGVTATSPVVSSGGAAPVISMPAATTSVSGYLTSTDWNTFNGKQASGTYVNSVSGTAPIVSSGGVTPAISIPAATTTVSGYLTSTDWNTFNGKQPAGSYVTSGGALGTPSSGTLTNCTFPTLNQNTTGTAANITATSNTSLTSLANLVTVGTITSGTWSGSFGAVSGANLTSLNGSNISSGTVAAARLGSGTPSSSNYLRGDGTWSTVSASPAGSNTQVQYNSSGSFAGSANFTFDGTNVLVAGTVSGGSDERLKTNWRSVQDNYITKLANVKAGIFDRTDLNITQPGVSAQSLREVLPEAVLEDENGMLSVNYGGAALLSVIELAKEIVALRVELEALKYPRTGA